MKIDNASVLDSAVNEIMVALQNGVELIKHGMWMDLLGLDREEYADDEIIKIMVDGEEQSLSAEEIDKVILNKCEDLTVDLEKAIRSKNGMVLILN